MLTPLVLLLLSFTHAALPPGTPDPDSAVLLPPEVKEGPQRKGVSPAVNVWKAPPEGNQGPARREPVTEGD